MRARNAQVLKLKMPAHNSYARQSVDQEAIEAYIAKHGVRQAVNTGKVFSFNGRGKRSVGHGLHDRETT